MVGAFRPCALGSSRKLPTQRRPPNVNSAVHEIRVGQCHVSETMVRFAAASADGSLLEPRLGPTGMARLATHDLRDEGLRAPTIRRALSPTHALTMLLLVASATRLSAQRDDAQRDDGFARRRQDMVELITRLGVSNAATLTAMRAVPRHEFVPVDYRADAYGDFALPIGYGQTISQPYIVAYMTEVLRPHSGMRVLEIGTGSGYQAAVLAAAGCEVYTVEIFEALATAARNRLSRVGYREVMVRHGDGHFGWSEHAPFDA
jgi:Protein-L-isoaspartate(D-aspartate) O-methyltransferase (PCMT)